MRTPRLVVPSGLFRSVYSACQFRIPTLLFSLAHCACPLSDVRHDRHHHRQHHHVIWFGDKQSESTNSNVLNWFDHSERKDAHTQTTKDIALDTFRVEKHFRNPKNDRQSNCSTCRQTPLQVLFANFFPFKHTPN